MSDRDLQHSIDPEYDPLASSFNDQPPVTVARRAENADADRIAEAVKRLSDHLGYCPHSTSEDEAAGYTLLSALAALRGSRERETLLARQLDIALSVMNRDIEGQYEDKLAALAASSEPTTADR